MNYASVTFSVSLFLPFYNFFFYIFVLSLDAKVNTNKININILTLHTWSVHKLRFYCKDMHNRVLQHVESTLINKCITVSIDAQR